MSQLWTEKFRPKNSTEFICPPHIKNFLEEHKSNFPHLLLYGPPGSGKTTFAHLIATPSKLELNASHERGIDVIRTKIKSFASSVSQKNTIILDECELLTNDAQQCLRRVIEDFSKTRFIFITNYPSKIILPLKSRLLALKFDFDTEEVLKRIATEKNLKVDTRKLFNLLNKDLRKSINILQSIAPLKAPLNLEEIVGQINEKIISDFWEMKNGKIFLNEFIRESYCIIAFINQLADTLDGKEDKRKAEFVLILSEIEEKAALGCEIELLVGLLCSKKILIFNK